MLISVAFLGNNCIFARKTIEFRAKTSILTMKYFILILLLSCISISTSAQTEMAKDLYAKATATGASADMIIKSETSKVDSTSCHDLAVNILNAHTTIILND